MIIGYDEGTIRLARAQAGNFVGEIYVDDSGTVLLRLTPGTMLSVAQLSLHLTDRLTTLELAVHTAAVSLYESRDIDLTTEDYDELKPFAQERIERLVAVLHQIESGAL